MAGLQTTVGLISGINIKEVVDQLIAVDSVPRDNLQIRQDKLKEQQAAWVQLTNLFNTTTYMMRNLSKVEIFDRRDVKSSNEAVLKATRTSNPQPGNYSFTPLKLAQAQTTLTTGVASDKTALGKEGEITIKFGRDLSTNYTLAEINGGEGFDRGYIRITDGTGARANIDLRTAQSMDDILDAINNCKEIDIFASMEGDRMVLKDLSGGTGTIAVQEVNNGTTARSLGLIGAELTDDVLKGKTLLRMGENTDLMLLNDGNGIAFDNMLPDLTVKLADGTSISIDFNALPSSTDKDATQQFATTVGDLLKTINDAGKVTTKVGGVDTQVQKMYATISDDGKRLVFVDNTYSADTPSKVMTISQNAATGGSTIKPILYQLGLAEWGANEVKATNGAIAGRAILGDMDSVLLSSLNGGRGFPEASLFDNVDEGKAAIIGAKDKNGNFTYITIYREEYAQAETLEDLCRMINTKLANGVRYEEGTTERIKKLVNDQPVQVTYEETGNIKYQTAVGSTKLPWDTKTVLSTIPTTGTPPGTNASWIYDKDDPSKVIGVKSDELTYFYDYGDDNKVSKIYAGKAEKVVIDADIAATYVNGKRPVLKKDGTPDIEQIPKSVDTGHESESTGKDNKKVTEYIRTEWTDPRDETKSTVITGYKVEGSDTVIALTTDEIQLLKDNKIGIGEVPEEGEEPEEGYNKRPILANGEIQIDIAIRTWDSTGSVAEIDYVHNEEYQFDVEWTFDEEDPTKVVGYTITKYGTITTPAVLEEINSHPPGQLLEMTAGTGGNAPTAKQVTYVQTTDEAGTHSLETDGFQWVYEDDDPNGNLLGYKLGDGKTQYFTQEERNIIAASPDGKKYPILKMEPEYEYETGVGLQVRVNADKTGLELVDTTGSYSGTMQFGDLGDYGGHFSVALGFGGGVEANATKIVGNDLHLQTFSRNTKIADLNGGQGVNMSGVFISITDTAGKSQSVDLSKMTTIGEIIDEINTISTSKLNVIARINDTGDGIVFLDQAGAKVKDFSISQTGGSEGVLAQLGIKTGIVKNTDLKTGETASLSGSTTYKIAVEKTDTLDDIRKKINEASTCFRATTVNDGSAKPYRLSIAGSATGAKGNMKIDMSVLGLDTVVMTKAQDACILYGDPDSGTSLMLNSKTNTITGVVPGITLTINGTSTAPINIWTENSPQDIKNSLTTFVDNYNKLKKFLNEQTLVDPNANVKGLLAQDTMLINLERDMNELLLKTFTNLGPVRTLADVGIKLVPVSELLNQDGTDSEENAEATTSAMLNAGLIDFDESVFDQLYESNPDAIKEFFTKSQDVLDEKGKIVQKQVGYASMFQSIYENYAYDPETSALNSKYNAMQRQIEDNERRLEFMQGRLDAKRTILLKKFYAMESAMARMQSDMSYVNKISSSSSSSTSS